MTLISFLVENGRNVANADEPIVGLNHPLFTTKETIVCESEDDLKTILALSESGQTNLLTQVEGCSIFPLAGVPVIVLEKLGVIDIWVRVRVMSGRKKLIYWTTPWMLRN